MPFLLLKEGQLMLVAKGVPMQVPPVLCPIGALITWVRPFPGVNTHVPLQLWGVQELTAAVGAEVALDARGGRGEKLQSRLNIFWRRLVVVGGYLERVAVVLGGTWPASCQGWRRCHGHILMGKKASLSFTPNFVSTNMLVVWRSIPINTQRHSFNYNAFSGHLKVNR